MSATSGDRGPTDPKRASAATPATPRLAATVVLARDGPAGRPEIFMVQRHHRSRFMASAHVFVGGRLEDADGAVEVAARCAGIDGGQASARLGLDDPGRALAVYVAAAREAFEESGVLLAAVSAGAPPLTEAALATLRRRLNGDDLGFAELLEQAGLQLSLDRLRYLSRWITPEFEPRRYDTYFFVAEVRPEQRASYDEHETESGGWFTIDSLLEDGARGAILLAPPTLMTLQQLASACSAAEVAALAGDRPVAPIGPRPLMHGAKELTLLLPDDHRYDDPSSPGGTEHFFALRGGSWVREYNKKS